MVYTNKTHTYAQQTLTKITLERVSMKINDILFLKTTNPALFNNLVTYFQEWGGVKKKQYVGGISYKGGFD